MTISVYQGIRGVSGCVYGNACREAQPLLSERRAFFFRYHSVGPSKWCEQPLPLKALFRLHGKWTTTSVCLVVVVGKVLAETQSWIQPTRVYTTLRIALDQAPPRASCLPGRAVHRPAPSSVPDKCVPLVARVTEWVMTAKSRRNPSHFHYIHLDVAFTRMTDS